MEMYLHNGKDVIFQYVAQPFINQLNNAGIYPEELPDLDNVIYKYTKGDVTRYALVIPVDGMTEKVYMTYSIPEDGFQALLTDVENQRNGETPAKMRTRYELACESARNMSFEDIKERYPEQNNDWLFYGLPEDIANERKSLEESYLLRYGYDADYLKKIDIKKEER